jgi:hypothetical protein
MKTRLSRKGILIVIAIGLAAILGPLRGPLSDAPYVAVPFQYFYYYLDHIKFWGPRLPSPNLRGLEIPTVNGKPVTGAPVGRHFRSSKTYFILVASPTNIYTQASDSSRYIETLSPGTRVRAVYQNEDISAQNTQGRGLWVFLTREDGRTPIGWAINNTLGYQDLFTPVTNWTISAFGMCIGEYCGEFTVNPSGRFTQKWDSIGRGIHLGGTNTGQFLKFQQLIWAKQDDPEDYDELLIQAKPNQLTHELKYSGEPIRISPPNGQSIRFSKSSLF